MHDDRRDLCGTASAGAKGALRTCADTDSSIANGIADRGAATDRHTDSVTTDRHTDSVTTSYRHTDRTASAYRQANGSATAHRNTYGPATTTVSGAADPDTVADGQIKPALTARLGAPAEVLEPSDLEFVPSMLEPFRFAKKRCGGLHYMGSGGCR